MLLRHERVGNGVQYISHESSAKDLGGGEEEDESPWSISFQRVKLCRTYAYCLKINSCISEDLIRYTSSFRRHELTVDDHASISHHPSRS